MSYNAAIYEPTTGFIFAVRNQWLYKCSATDGSVIGKIRFTTNSNYPTVITAFNGTIYCGVLWTPLNDFNSGTSPDKDIFKVNASTFLVSGRCNVGCLLDNVDGIVNAGYVALGTDGTYLSGYTQGTDASVNIFSLFAFDPANFPASLKNGQINYVDDFTYDSVNGVYWVADNFARWLWVGIPYPPPGAPGPSSWAHPNALVQPFHGVTYNEATNKVYLVYGHPIIYMIDAATAVAAIAPSGGSFTLNTTFDTGRTNANPCRIKSCNGLSGNPYNGKVLIPAFYDDTVLVWDPATDDVNDMVVKTGFTSPIDIVHCPTASFAVQNSLVGLKKIE